VASGTGYFIYLGRTTQDITVKYVEFYVSTAGSGAQTAEVALLSSPSAPNKANQTLTKLAATGTVDSLTSTGVKRNTSAFEHDCFSRDAFVGGNPDSDGDVAAGAGRALSGFESGIGAVVGKCRSVDWFGAVDGGDYQFGVVFEHDDCAGFEDYVGLMRYSLIR
jgi:hypothetical protein